MNQEEREKPEEQREFDDRPRPDWEEAYDQAASPNGPNNEDIDEEVDVLDRHKPEVIEDEKQR